MSKKKSILLIMILAIILVVALTFSIGFFNSKIKGLKTFSGQDQYNYIMDLQDRVEENWAPPKEIKYEQVPVVSFVLYKDGKVSNVRLTTSSGNKQIDDLAVKTIEKSAPFRPIPKNIDVDTVDFDFQFEFQE